MLPKNAEGNILIINLYYKTVRHYRVIKVKGQIRQSKLRQVETGYWSKEIVSLNIARKTK